MERRRTMHEQWDLEDIDFEDVFSVDDPDTDESEDGVLDDPAGPDGVGCSQPNTW